METLSGKVALVTGGGRGLGEAISCVLADAGVTVVPADIKLDLVQKVSDSINSNGGQAMPLEMDVSNPESVQKGIHSVIRQFGKLDILVNNAGTDKTESVEEISVEDWTRVINVNLVGPFLTSKYVFEHMKNNGGGQIINIASTAAKRAWANASAYHASKWGLLGFSHALHVEGRPVNIKVTAILAGGMRTPFLLDRFPDIDINNLQEPHNVAETVKFVLTMPKETVIPEMMVIPMRETSWP
jgi:NAD(P)-dependent dehydrogenase (short-subunit alcohol dehydrogenase family)